MRFQNLSVLVALGLAVGACDRRAAHEHRAEPAVNAELAPPRAAPQRVRAVGQLGPGRGTLVVSLEAPANGKLTTGAPLRLEASGEHLEFPTRIDEKLDPEKLPLRIPVDVADGATGPAHVKLHYFWCGSGEGSACRPERAELVVELDTSGDSAGGEAHLTHRAAGS
ncbi:MAG: hypothetical protein HS104_23875 [Polyangiaceae bacterium]|nr:hypothetical protein [Polyangiaceae bacterium]MBK9002223.1 hypothetical protein [Myxococcales bacterium]MCE7891767.1 hypothetical protein [Sorangiineae bacterium PRO1]MCL4751920.1 hypothetical protein [Myxococcales bacterium]